jgi:cytochrome b
VSASRADDATARTGGVSRILVWDAPVRVFHWLMVLCFVGAYVTAESERWRLVHVTLGYTMAGLVAFRLVWGLIGTRHARFASFVRGPAAVWRYLRSLHGGAPEHHIGHNPAGALAIVALLVLAAVVTTTGWAAYGDLGGEWLEELHEGLANAMLAVVGVHVGAVLLSSWLHRENLIGAMVSGRKPGSPGDAVRTAWRSVAAAIVVAVLAFWWAEWRQAPTGDGERAGAVAAAKHRAHGNHRH